MVLNACGGDIPYWLPPQKLFKNMNSRRGAKNLNLQKQLINS